METPNETLDSFIHGAERLEELLQGLNDTTLNFSAGEGQWSIRQIVHHLADDGDVYCNLIKSAIATPGRVTRMEGYPGNDAWAAALHFAHRDIAPSVALIKAHRVYIARLVSHFPDAWDNALTIQVGDENWPTTVGKIIAMLDEHMEEHQASILQLRRAQGME